jgi:hypothetical protein
MMNYWYVARPNELFLDIDNVSKSIKHARSRLQGAIECGNLNVEHIMQRPSKSKNHLHVIVTLKDQQFLGPAKYAWEVVLHGDIYRACCNILRWHRSIPGTDILISQHYFFSNPSNEQAAKLKPPFIVYQRNADDKCDCTEKHKASVMKDCPAAKRLRGEFRAVGFFGKPSKNPCTIWPDL